MKDRFVQWIHTNKQVDKTPHIELIYMCWQECFIPQVLEFCFVNWNKQIRNYSIFFLIFQAIYKTPFLKYGINEDAHLEISGGKLGRLRGKTKVMKTGDETLLDKK